MKSFLHSLLRVIRFLVIGVFGLAFVLIAAYVLINISDEDLKPEVAALLKRPAQAAPATENAYLAMIGLAAPADAEPRAWAEQWIAAAQKIVDVPSAKAFYQSSDRIAIRKRPLDCSPASGTCLTKFASARDATASAIATESVLLSRYDSARRLPRFAEVYDHSTYGNVATPMPNITGVPNAQFLVFGRVAVSAADDKIEDALADLEADVAFYRRILSSSTSIFFRSIAMEWLSRDLLVLSDLMRGARGPARSHAARIRAMTVPLTKEERDLTVVLRDEFRWNALLLEPVAFADSSGDVAAKALKWIAHRGFKPNASKNLLYQVSEPGLALGTAAPDAIEKADKEMVARASAILEGIHPYNWAGRFEVGTSGLGFADLAYRTNDLDGLLRLVHLQAALLEKRVASAEITAFIAAQDKALSNPYSGKPMNWDAERDALWFEPRSRKWRSAKIGGTNGRVTIAN